jgi:hypothetical protein
VLGLVEVVLSTSRIVLCGNHQADWGCFFNTFLFLFLHAGSAHTLEGSYRTSLDIIFHRLPIAVEERWRKSVAIFMRLGTLAMDWDEYYPPILLREALHELRGSSMTDKRDAVYAILSLASDITPMGLDINYRLDRLEVFKMATRKMIEQSRCLDILCDAPTCVHGEIILPSWLPRFDYEELPCGCRSFARSTLTFQSTRNRSPSYKETAITPSYFASQGRKVEAITFTEENQLITDCIIMDRVQVVMQRPIWTPVLNGVPELTIPKEWFSLALHSDSLAVRGAMANHDCKPRIIRFL